MMLPWRGKLAFRHAREFNPLLVGAVSFIVVAALVAGAFAVGTFGLFQHTYAMSGVFSDSSGIHKGAPVLDAGVQVGKVTGVTPDFQRGQVVITWNVNHGVHLGPETRADIGTATLLGGDMIRLTQTQGTPYLESRSGADRRIPIERTSVPYTVISALTDATNKIKQIDIPTLNQLIQQVGNDFSATAPDLPDLLQNFQKIAGAVASRHDQLQGLIANSQQVTSTLASRDQQLVELIDRGNQLIGVLNSQRQQLSSALGAGSGIVKTLGDTITAKKAQIESILNDLHTTLGLVNRQLPNINATLGEMGSTFDRLTSALGPNSFVTQVTGISVVSIGNAETLLDLLIKPLAGL